MIVLVLLLALLVVGLGFAWVNEGGKTKTLTADLEAAQAETARVQERLEREVEKVVAIAKERDDALERASRAKRDAAEVAKRHKNEVEARIAAEEMAELATQGGVDTEEYAALAAERDQLAAERERLAAEVEADAEARSTLSEERDRLVKERERLEADLAAAEAHTMDADESRLQELWELALAGVQRTWEISVCPSPGMPSPLEGTDDSFHVAVQVEVDAAREEAGALIDLTWVDEGVVPVRLAVRALPLVQELVAQLSKAADTAELTVTAAPDKVTIHVDAKSPDGDPVHPSLSSDYEVEPGQYVLGG